MQGGQIANFGEKNPRVHLIIIREWPKNTPPPPAPSSPLLKLGKKEYLDETFDNIIFLKKMSVNCFKWYFMEIFCRNTQNTWWWVIWGSFDVYTLFEAR